MVEVAPRLEPTIRPARRNDCRTIAELFSISSGGVADYVWSQIEPEADDLIAVGARRYERVNTLFSYENCIMALSGRDCAGMMVSFPMPADELGEDEEEADPVLAPYGELEVPGSYYVCGIALFPNFRSQGLGRHMMGIAQAKAREQGCDTLSLIAFEQNEGAVRLYERLGYSVVDRRRVVPHPLIRYTGDALLMTAPV